jgi:hypothetical protein
MAFEASADFCGKHAHLIDVIDVEQIPASVAAWLYSLDQAKPEPAIRWLLQRIALCRITTPEYFREVCSVAGKLCVGLNFKASPKPIFSVGVKSPSASSELERLSAACVSGSIRECSHLMYHLTLNAMGAAFSNPTLISTTKTSGYELLLPVLSKFADECLFPLTNDRYLHQLIGLHVPSWACVSTCGGPYEELSDLYGAAANNIARPFMDTPCATLLSQRPHCERDDVVLFILATTLISELSTDIRAAPVCNRDILLSLSSTFTIPRPFVLCDFPVPGVMTDAYGFIDPATKQLVIGNGSGVAATIGAWLKCCERTHTLETIVAFVNGCAGPTNPLMKYAS